jgi:hypothetical protein
MGGMGTSKLDEFIIFCVFTGGKYDRGATEWSVLRGTPPAKRYSGVSFFSRGFGSYLSFSASRKALISNSSLCRRACSALTVVSSPSISLIVRSRADSFATMSTKAFAGTKGVGKFCFSGTTVPIMDSKVVNGATSGVEAWAASNMLRTSAGVG